MQSELQWSALALERQSEPQSAHTLVLGCKREYTEAKSVLKSELLSLELQLELQSERTSEKVAAAVGAAVVDAEV